MARKRHKPPEIVAKPRQVVVSTGHGKSIAEAVEPRIPNMRKGSYFPGFLEPRRQAAGIQEAYIQGTLTSALDDRVKAMGMSGISKSQVSRLCEEIDEQVHAFLDRPIEGDWPCLWVDATCVTVR